MLLPETTANDIIPVMQVSIMSMAGKVISKNEEENHTNVFLPGVKKANNTLNNSLLPLCDTQGELL